jgi:hypothetical protein
MMKSIARHISTKTKESEACFPRPTQKAYTSIFTAKKKAESVSDSPATKHRASPQYNMLFWGEAIHRLENPQMII